MDKGEAMEEVKHTAGPWQAMGTHICAGEFDEFVADCNSESDKPTDAKLDRANAARIVQCVNAHDGLVEALDEYIRDIGTVARGLRQSATTLAIKVAIDTLEAMAENARAALSKARQP